MRGSYLAGVIEVELPRWSITPLDRDEADYWALNARRSDLAGGTWTVFHWNKVATGRKLYRLQYSTDLREPQAEANLEEILAFLLDRGAVPDPKGIHMLRLAGLFTPIGTSLLLSPDHRESVLRISVSDDSDGVLSLALHWRPSFDRRAEGALPPSWMRVDSHHGEKELEETGQPPSVCGDASGEPPQNEEDSSKKLPTLSDKTMPMRFHLGTRAGALKIDRATWESGKDPVSLDQFSIDHLQEAWARQWLPAAAAALGQLRGLPVWTCNIPGEIASLAQRDALPCGVLVMSGILDEKESPLWETKYDPHEDAKENHRQLLVESSCRNAVRRLPPAQAEAARILRGADNSNSFHTRMQDRFARDRGRREQRDQEALVSPRLDTLSVAKAALQYLQAHHGFDACRGTEQATEKILHTVLWDAGPAKEVCELLNAWQQWSERGGMNLENLALCTNHPVDFAMAICLMACLKLARSQETSSLALDLQECVRVWKKVRLG
ncbi:MAG: hypothetical protein MMC23_005651 [Stictis urceolatum]|nr:hypothetical protein [Stictis urceolata]